MSPPSPFDESEVIESRDMGGLAGYAVGVLYMATPFAFVPGNIQNVTTLPFPVAYERVDGISIPELLEGHPRMLEALLPAQGRLERRGVRIIIGACGSFANFQQELAHAASVPVFSSILTQIPWLLSALPRAQRIAVVFADSRSFTPRIQEQCRIQDASRLVVADCMALEPFRAMLEHPYRLAHRQLEAAVASHLRELVKADPQIGLIMLQCSELPPYAAAIQRATGRPVVDVVNLALWAQSAARRHTYSGHL
ncbi:MAG: aspartate/glutamate racemase family protein [Steroidobacteraceae bacterium]